MIRDEITDKLFSLQDKEYGTMQKKIIPTVEKDRIIGVRTPALRSYAKELVRNSDPEAF